MPKVILFPVNGTPADAETFALALATGRLFDAHLVALHVRPDVRQDIAMLASSDGGMAVGIDHMTEEMEADADERDRIASAGFRAFCQENNIGFAREPREGLTAEWVSEVGTEANVLAAHGRAADLIVMGRGDEKWGPDTILMEAGIMESGKPVLIAASRQLQDPFAVPNLTGTIGIAWKDTREAAGAVRAVQPFLASARNVIIFAVMDPAVTDLSPERLAHRLRWHNPNVIVQPLLEHSRAPAEVVLDAAVQAGCGLLAMGGYGRSSLMEAMFGGFTSTVLATAPLPVLVAH